jgi:hypothetical protein
MFQKSLQNKDCKDRVSKSLWTTAGVNDCCNKPELPARTSMLGKEDTFSISYFTIREDKNGES